MSKLLWLSLCAGGVLLGANACLSGENQSPNVAKLVAEAGTNATVEGYVLLRTNPLAEGDVPGALAYIRRHADCTSFFVLLAVRKYYPASYKRVPNGVKIAILCSALKNRHCLNDFGNLDADDPTDTAINNDGAKALLETGKQALKCLRPILDDDRSAPLSGSDEAAASSLYKYRRKDYAYRYASLILGETPVFRADPKRRDKDIENLKAELKKATK
jgi:hypothetical protein